MTNEQIVKKIEMNIRRIEQWMSDNNNKSPRLLKVLTSLDELKAKIVTPADLGRQSRKAGHET